MKEFKKLILFIFVGLIFAFSGSFIFRDGVVVLAEDDGGGNSDGGDGNSESGDGNSESSDGDDGDKSDNDSGDLSGFDGAFDSVDSFDSAFGGSAFDGLDGVFGGGFGSGRGGSFGGGQINTSELGLGFGTTAISVGSRGPEKGGFWGAVSRGFSGLWNGVMNAVNSVQNMMGIPDVRYSYNVVNSPTARKTVDIDVNVLGRRMTELEKQNLEGLFGALIDDYNKTIKGIPSSFSKNATELAYSAMGIEIVSKEEYGSFSTTIRDAITGRTFGMFTTKNKEGPVTSRMEFSFRTEIPGIENFDVVVSMPQINPAYQQGMALAILGMAIPHDLGLSGGGSGDRYRMNKPTYQAIDPSQCNSKGSKCWLGMLIEGKKQLSIAKGSGNLNNVVDALSKLGQIQRGVKEEYYRLVIEPLEKTLRQALAEYNAAKTEAERAAASKKLRKAADDLEKAIDEGNVNVGREGDVFKEKKIRRERIEWVERGSEGGGGHEKIRD